MQPYELIRKEWVVSLTARRVYRVSAAASLTLYFCLTTLRLNQRIPFFTELLFIGILGTAVTGIGMEYFLFRFDNSHALKQIFWFVAMIFAPLGPALYCFLVYSRSDAFEKQREEPTEAALS
jgi:hypothetical protein